MLNTLWLEFWLSAFGLSMFFLMIARRPLLSLFLVKMWIFVATIFLADGIKAWMRVHSLEMGQISVAVRKGAESMGRIYNMPFRPMNSFSAIDAAATVEILERLPLLDSGIDDPPNGSTVLLAGVHVLDPFSLMVCKLHAFNTRPASERGHDLEHLKILAALMPDAEKLCRSHGISLVNDVARLEAVLSSGSFPLPLDSPSASRLVEAIAAARI